MESANEQAERRILAALTKSPIRKAAAIDAITGLNSRVVDRCLQRLHKRGFIKLVKGAGGGWVLA